MREYSMQIPALTIGLDLGDRKSHVFALTHDGEILSDKKITTSRQALLKGLGKFSAARVIIEAGTHSHWVSRLLSDLGHEVIVANPRAIHIPCRKNRRKNDRIDAQALARLGRADPKLLAPLTHRGPDAQADLATIRARDCLVRSRTQLVNHVRSSVKTFGYRLPSTSTPAFHRKVRDLVPAELRSALDPLLDMIAELTKKISSLDREISRLVAVKYPEARRLKAVPGVGDLTALAFVLTLEDPGRFRKSRQVGPYIGLVPKLDESGDHAPQLRISKAGDSYLRRLLVGSSQYILGPFGQDCDLRRYGERLRDRGGKNAYRRAVVAMARKLAVLLHKLWQSETEYDPHFCERRREAA
jgi:transposase